ncbi:MAG: cell wall-binding repeat-containing protein, partial [Gracilibacteraceae bacterium]|nr:cell wall-binding repeat-containing protein [Gracilibacteraceae bacterium]
MMMKKNKTAAKLLLIALMAPLLTLLALALILPPANLLAASGSDELNYSNVAKEYLYDAKIQYNTLPGKRGSRSGLPTAEAGGHSNFTAAGNLHIAYETEQSIVILALDHSMNKIRALTVSKELPLFGEITGDDAGNFYVLYGKNVEETEKNVTNVVLAKYNPDGKFIAKTEYTAGEINTMQPFRAANASLAVSGNVIAVHSGRLMFKSADGLNHQSSLILYADVQNMQPLQLPEPYTSHSFDQQVIPLFGGGFLFADRGDAYPRGFVVAKLENNQLSSVATFHFREAEEYNYTNSDLGGVAETDFSYVLVGSSDKTLSNRPVKISNFASRNVFIQYIKKDFEKYDVYSAGDDVYFVQGESRSAEGIENTIGLNVNGISYFLPPDATDHGVCWLTNLNENQSTDNPTVTALSDGRLVVMWELYDSTGSSSLQYAGTYYKILDQNGEVITDATFMVNSPRIPNHDRPVYLNGKIYWSLSDESAGKIRVYELDIDNGLKLSYISGQNRVLTSVAISRQGWTSAGVVILAPGGQNNLIDALAVAPLAGQENAPILLSVDGRLDPAVPEEIKRLGAKKVYA